MFYKLSLYLKRRRMHSYTELWEMLYGDGEFNKGLIREYQFAREVSRAWKESYEMCKKTHSDKID